MKSHHLCLALAVLLIDLILKFRMTSFRLAGMLLGRATAAPAHFQVLIFSCPVASHIFWRPQKGCDWLVPRTLLQPAAPGGRMMASYYANNPYAAAARAGPGRAGPGRAGPGRRGCGAAE